MSGVCLVLLVSWWFNVGFRVSCRTHSFRVFRAFVAPASALRTRDESDQHRTDDRLLGEGPGDHSLGRTDIGYPNLKGVRRRRFPHRTLSPRMLNEGL
jgi:hypothetical protein